MARNEEKQQGRLNRLWLQKEREEGRIRDAHPRRPKLSTLNSTSSVKRWIPSIKSEIEYYLQQSQLAHYPERKMAEFRLSMDRLEVEYKRFLAKLRALDPTCKHRPWTPRGYSRRRAPPTRKKQRSDWLQDGAGVESEPASGNEAPSSSAERQEGGAPPEAVPERSGPPSDAQDRPLAFDATRLAVALAGRRGPGNHPGAWHAAHPLTRALHLGLPNLAGPPPQGRSLPAAVDGDRPAPAVDPRTADLGSCAPTPERSAQTPGGALLGLGCYSSSGEEEEEEES